MTPKKTALDKNKEYSNKYVQEIKNPKIEETLKRIIKKRYIKKVIDLGCGDGFFIQAIKKEFPKIKTVGIDISERRIEGLKSKFPKDSFYCKDVCKTKINEKFDLVHSSQVIEHVEDDYKMVEEIKRLTKKGGIVFVSTVIKKPWAIYKYRNNGKFVLDPTHEREYKNKKEFLDLFKEEFRLIKYKIMQTKRKIFGITINIPGFYEIEGIWEKIK